MSTNTLNRVIAALLAGLIVVPTVSASATTLLPVPGRAAVTGASNASGIVEVRDHDRRHHKNRHHGRRHHRGNGGHHRHHDGFNPGAALAIGLIGSLVAEGLDEGSARSAIDRCDARYRSFERSTGYYTTYGGNRRLCPYLR